MPSEVVGKACVHDGEGSEPLKKAVWVFAGLLLVCATALLPSCQRARGDWHGEQRLIILGIDGMDPQLLKQFMREGKMPNFSKLASQGSFRLLTTSIPPQSPVAWSNLITGNERRRARHL